MLGYQALLQAATTVLAAAGYRTRGAQGHHANAFYALSALAIEGLVDVDIRTERVRQMRKLSAYDPGTPALEQIQQLRKLLDDSLPAAVRWLAVSRPGVKFSPVR